MPDSSHISLPQHVAIIMDGNGRWARSRGWLRHLGHKQGAKAVRTTTEECVRLGVRFLTLYAFSSENWSRPAKEVDTLMNLLKQFLDDEEPLLHEHGIRLGTIGQIDRLPPKVRTRLAEVQSATAHYNNLVLTLALSYGGRNELVDACQRIAQKVAAGVIDPQSVSSELFAQHLDTAGMPDVDLVIRTAGEQRLSNFLPWQTTYAEYVSVEPYWPDFSPKDLQQALQEFGCRQRRFGRVENRTASRTAKSKDRTEETNKDSPAGALQ